jgi:hypothetical protein
MDQSGTMARKTCIHFPGGLNHVLDRDNRCEANFREDSDRKLFPSERILVRALGALALERAEFRKLKKNDKRKTLTGALVRRRTTASNRWIARRLWMGDPSRVSRHCANGRPGRIGHS